MFSFQINTLHTNNLMPAFFIQGDIAYS